MKIITVAYIVTIICVLFLIWITAGVFLGATHAMVFSIVGIISITANWTDIYICQIFPRMPDAWKV